MNNMLCDINSFKAIQLIDKPIFDNYFMSYPSNYCDYNFVNLIVWNDASGVTWQEACGRLYIFFSAIDSLLFPVGKPVAPFELNQISKDMLKNGKSGTITVVKPEYIEDNRSELEHFFLIEEDLDYQDYIYSSEKLALLSGKKLQKKKNLVSQFKRLYPNYTARALLVSDKQKCLKLTDTWTELNDDTDDYLNMELKAIHRTWDYFNELGVEGVIISVENQAVAYAVYSRQSSTTADVHFEKYHRGYKGSGQIINQETALILKEKYILINREQDLQMEGLRKAKMSYDPEMLLKAFSLKPKL